MKNIFKYGGLGEDNLIAPKPFMNRVIITNYNSLFSLLFAVYFGLDLFIDGLEQVANWLVPKKFIRGLKYSKARPLLQAYFLVAISPSFKRAGSMGKRVFLI